MNGKSLYSILCNEKEAVLKSNSQVGSKEKQHDLFFISEEVSDWSVEHFTAIFDEVMKQRTLSSVDSNYDSFEERRKATTQHIYTVWGKGLDFFELYIESAIDLCEEHSNATWPEAINSMNQSLLGLMKVLNGKALLCANEVLCLLESGYPHAAIARWRTLYELWIVCEYIAFHGNEMAERFILHKTNDADFSWATSDYIQLSEGQEIHFRTLESFVHEFLKTKHKLRYKKWYKEYNTSNKLLHVTPIGVFGYWDDRQLSDQINVGSSDAGFLKPACNTIGCLFNINSTFLRLVDSDIAVLSCIFLHKLSDNVTDSFIAIDTQLEKQE